MTDKPSASERLDAQKRAEDLFHAWAKLPDYEKLDEDMAISLVCRIRDEILAARDAAVRERFARENFDTLKSQNAALTAEVAKLKAASGWDDSAHELTWNLQNERDKLLAEVEHMRTQYVKDAETMDALRAEVAELKAEIEDDIRHLNAASIAIKALAKERDELQTKNSLIHNEWIRETEELRAEVERLKNER